MWSRRILRSLRQRGISGSLGRVLSVLQERIFDLRYGTDTVSFADLKSLTIDGEHAAEGTPYQPTRLRLVRQVLSALVPAPGGAFVDFGCGKGRVLLLAADYGFRRVTGVEFAKELCEIARDNVARYRRKTGIQTDIRIVEGDAVEYEVQDDENVFFLSNPFSAALVEKVAKNIARSLTSKGRRGLIIYNNPLWSEAIEQRGFSPFLDFNARECLVYGNTLDFEKQQGERRRVAA
jgi:SAM-dependent methyltransferase